MSSLDFREKRLLEELFQMSSGYVLDFSDRTFGEFFDDVADTDIHSDRYQSQGSSKAKKLRSFWDTEPDPIVGKVLLALVELLETPSDPFGSGEIDPEHNELVSKCRDIANRLHVGGPNLGALTQNAARLDAMYLQQ
ncbi:MAG: abortive infection family protein, partial [Chloroflexota bacterium]|nr:abortive infection family protein [Chloroflexota bacterium]